MATVFIEPDGLYLAAQATLVQLVNDETLPGFADGLLHSALVFILRNKFLALKMSLTEALHYADGPGSYPLLTVLLTLDAEVRANLGNETRIMPLPGFLSYRPSLPLDQVPLDSVRLPPLNPGGRYRLAISGDGAFLAVRFDLHPNLNVAGHVRLAVSSLSHPPVRLLTVERRLDRQVLTESLIETAIDLSSRDLLVPLSPMARIDLVETLKKLMSETTADG